MCFLKNLENTFWDTLKNTYMKEFFRECDQFQIFLQIWSYLLKKSWLENFIFGLWNIWSYYSDTLILL